jgi:hydroxymethylpyrimidine pyrophosphatase-like HAD family hydrolase
VSQRNTAAIGDYDNDLEMIQWAGYGAAIGNALPRVKAAAEITVGTNEEGGVADFVDHLLSKR